jgi:dTDP-4-dehydrorhamnose 3,5-epimerase-like enzyme
MIPKIITGNSHSDTRGTLCYNNDFDASAIKRMYVIDNATTEIIRAWQGHRIEQRWFSTIQGSFEIKLIEVDDWENPSKNVAVHSFILSAIRLDVLHIPQGYISSIQALEPEAKLLVMADYLLGEINDEYRFDADYFKN